MITVGFLLILLLALQIMDVFTTVEALARGAREANPLMARLQKIFPEEWALIKVGFVMLAVTGICAGSKAAMSYGEIGGWMWCAGRITILAGPIVAIVISVYVVVNNLIVMRKQGP